jgi:hypothetical protein
VLQRLTTLLTVGLALGTSAVGKAAWAERIELNDGWVSKYADEVKKNTEAHKTGPVSADDMDEVYDHAADLFNDHTEYEESTGTTYADDELSHFLTAAESYSRWERNFARSWHGHRGGTFYSEMYQRRLAHVRECWICGGFSRRLYYRTGIETIPFDPPYAYYEGRRYAVRDGYFPLRNRYFPIRYDYRHNRWCVGPNDEPLTF